MTLLVPDIEGSKDPARTTGGLVIRRRCDECGTRTEIAADNGETCVLKCYRCGKEYKFHSRPNQYVADGLVV